MKGIVFNLLEDVVSRTQGEDSWEAVLSAAGLDGAYTSLGSYPDEEIVKLVGTYAAMHGRTPAEVWRWFGRQAIPLLAQHYPVFFDAHTSARSFILSLNDIIHPEVRKVYPGADVPEFDFHDAPDGALLMGYQSRRKLCSLAQGFIEGAAVHYGETLALEHPSCMLKGDAKCVFWLSFAPIKARSQARFAQAGIK